MRHASPFGRRIALVLAVFLIGSPLALATPSRVLRATLKNGLKVVIVRDPLAPVVTQQITYFVGSNEAPKGFPGTAHAQEHMMFRGSPGLSGNQLAEIAAQMGGDMDAFTTQNMTSFFFTVPASDVKLALHIGALRMRGVNDNNSQWGKERGAIEQEVARDNSNPTYVLYTKLLKHMYAGTPYAHTALGTKASFNKTTGKLLKHFHDKWYAPNNALLVVTGDVHPKSLLKTIRRLYGRIPSKKLPPKPRINLHPVKARTYTSSTDQPYGLVLVAFRMPGLKSKNYPAVHILSQTLGSKRGNIAGLVYAGKVLAAGFQMQPLPDTSVGFAYAAFPPGGSAKAARKALVGAIQKTLKQGIPKALVAAAKRGVALGRELDRNSVSGLANSWTHALVLAGVRSPNQLFNRLMAVNDKAVNEQLHTQLDLSHAVTLMLTPTPGAQPKAGSKFGGPESFSTKPKKHVKLPAWAKTALARLPHPKPLFKPAQYRLANGLRLIVQPLHVSHAISLYASVHTNEDLQAPKGQEGVSSVLDSLFAWGPKGMGRLKFESETDKLGANIGANSGGFHLQVLPGHFDAALQLLGRDVLNPALPQSAFRRMQMILAHQVAGQVHSPLFKFQQAVGTVLYPAKDPALRMATPKSINGLTRKAVRAYYRKTFRPDETTIVVIGPVNPKQIKSEITKVFGHWKATGAKPSLAYPKIPASHRSQRFVPDAKRKQDRVVLAETLGLTQSNPAHYALELGNDLLDGGFYASPLYRQLREQRGLVYSLDSSMNFGKRRSTYQLAYGAYPDKVKHARQIAVRVLSGMARQPLPASELHLAKAIGLRQIELTNQSVGDIAGSWLDYADSGLPLDQAYIVAHHFENLSAPAIQKAFKKYFSPARLSTVVLGKPIGKK